MAAKKAKKTIKKAAAKKTVAKKTVSRARSSTTGSASRANAPAAAGGPNRAQAEFARYQARMAGAPGGSGAPFMNPSYPPGGGVPAWGMPPGPGGPWAPAGGESYPAPPGESMSDRLGTALRLGLDVLNAGLAGGVRALGGIAGTASALSSAPYGMLPGADCYHDHGCCCDPCCCDHHHHHGYHDCCCLMGAGHPDCCHGSVGSCCG